MRRFRSASASQLAPVRARYLALGLCAMSGCSDGKKAPEARRAPEVLQLIGPSGSVTGVVERWPGGSLHVGIGKDATCGGYFRRTVRSESVWIGLNAQLAPDGTESWAVRDISTAPRHMAKPDPGTHASSVIELPDGAVKLELALSARTTHGEMLEAHGTVVASPCPDKPPILSPPTRSTRTTATMTIAGQRLAVQGAVIRGDVIELSDARRSCAPTWLTGATLVHAPDGTWSLSGTRFAIASHGGDGLVVTPGKRRRTVDGSEISTIALSGRGTVGAYSVVLDGEIDAWVCSAANPNPADVAIENRASGHTGAPDNDQAIGCAMKVDDEPGPRAWCYARTADGDMAACEAVDSVTESIIAQMPVHARLRFEWRPALLADREPSCATIASFGE